MKPKTRHERLMLIHKRATLAWKSASLLRDEMPERGGNIWNEQIIQPLKNVIDYIDRMEQRAKDIGLRTPR